MFLENIHFVWHMIIVLLGDISSLPWYYATPIFIFLGYTFFAVYAFKLLIGYGKGSAGAPGVKKYKGSTHRIPLMKHMGVNDINDFNYWLGFLAIFVFLFTKYVFWIPFISLKVVCLMFLFSYVAFYYVAFFCYGFMLFKGMFSVFIAALVLAIMNINMGLPTFPPHYMFDWWGWGVDSGGLIPAHNFSLNPTDYTVNYNQVFYIIISFIGASWLVTYAVNWLWHKKIHQTVSLDKNKVVDLDGHDLFTGDVKEASEPLENMTSTESNAYTDLKLFGLAPNTIEIIKAKFSELMISEIIHEIKNSDSIENPKSYLLKKLEESTNHV